VVPQEQDTRSFERKLALFPGQLALQQIVDGSVQPAGDDPQHSRGRLAPAELDLVQEGPAEIAAGDLGEAYRNVAALSLRPIKFTLTSPYMLARMMLDTHYHDHHALTLALADVLAGQVQAIDAAVVQVGRLRVHGFAGWVTWLTVHLVLLISFRSRILVLINWAYDYFFYDRPVRLILEAARSPRESEEDQNS